MSRSFRVAFTGVKEKAEIEEFETPIPGKGWLLVKTQKTLISTGTEGAFFSGIHTRWRPGVRNYPGYSNTGVVSKLGEGVTEFSVGAKIYSQGPHASHCLASVTPSHIGSFTEGLKIPESVSFEEAAFTTLAAVSLYGVRRAGIQLGEKVAVVGLGLVGQLALQLAKLSGATTTIGVDLFDNRREIAQKLGADYIFNPLSDDVAEIVKTITDGGADVVINATGNPGAIGLVLSLARRRGRAIMTGVGHGIAKIDFYSQVGADIYTAAQPENPTAETIVYRFTKRRERLLILSLISRGILHVKELITHRFRYTEAEKAYLTAIREKDSSLGIILDWG